MEIPGAKPSFENISGITKDIKTVLSSGRLILGNYTKQFEDLFSKYIKTKYAITVNSGTSALEIVLRFFNVKDKEVLVPANTFISCVNSIIFAKAKPIFVEINPNNYDIDFNDIKKKITKKTKVVMVVHLAGLPIPEIMGIKKFCSKHKLILIEDCSHAHGAMFNKRKVGSIGNAGCFSFYPTKVMTTCLGGMITTNNKKLAEFTKCVRHHGFNFNLEKHIKQGNNWLMDEIRAILGIYQLKSLDKNIEKRNRIARKYMETLDKTNKASYFKVPKNIRHAYYKFLFRVNTNKNELIDILKYKFNISANTLYSMPCYKHPLYTKKEKPCLITEKALKHQVSLPIYTQMTNKEIDYVTKILRFEL